MNSPAGPVSAQLWEPHRAPIHSFALLFLKVYKKDRDSSHGLWHPTQDLIQFHELADQKIRFMKREDLYLT